MIKVVTLLICLVGGTSFSTQTKDCDSTMTLGLEGHWPPYAFRSDNNRSGIDVEIIEIVLSEAGICLNYIDMPSSKRGLNELEAGNVDILPSMSYTIERTKVGIYSVPYRQEKIAIFWQPEKHPNLRDADLNTLLKSNLKGVAHLGGYYGTENDKLIKEQNKKSIASVATMAERMKMLLRHRVDFIINEEKAGLYYLNGNNITDIKLHPYLVYENNVSYMFSRKTVTQSQVDKINLIIVNKKAEIEQIINSYSHN